jgi:hypothetical protein
MSAAASLDLSLRIFMFDLQPKEQAFTHLEKTY